MSDAQRPPALTHPRGAWVVRRVLLTILEDPENADGPTLDQLEAWINLKLGDDLASACVAAEEFVDDEGGWVHPIVEASSGIDYPTDYDVYPPDDWPERIQPLVSEDALCPEHGQPGGECCVRLADGTWIANGSS